MTQRYNARGHEVLPSNVELVKTKSGRRIFVQNFRLRNTRFGSTWMGRVVTKDGDSNNAILLAADEDILSHTPCVMNLVYGEYEAAK